MNSVTINGRKIIGGRSISVVNSTVIVDGKKVDVGEVKNGILEVHVTGLIENLEADGSVTCENVSGTVQAGGSVHCDSVGGNVQAGGSVHCDDVGGSIMAGGSVSHG